MPGHRSPKDFFRPLAVGAPAPLREIPVRPSRMIHFFPASNPKMVAKVPDMAAQVDLLPANLEDGGAAPDKEAARAGMVEVGKKWGAPDTQLWTRVNSLDSPWGLDDLITAVTEVGDALDVIMIPKVEGPEDIHYVDRLLAQLEARAGLTEPLLVHAILETARGVANVEEIWCARPPTPTTRTHRVPPTSRTCGITRWPAWSPPACPMACCRTTGRSATSRTSSPARTSSATPSCSAASAPGACTPHRSTSPSGCSARIPPTWPTPRRSSRPWATAPAPSCSTGRWRTTPRSSSAR